MHRILLLVALLGTFAIAEKEIGTFRLKQDPTNPMRVWILEATSDGLRVEYVGGGKRATMADRTTAERATGYVRGGISPLGQRKRLPTVVDASALAYPTVYVSAGRRGLQVQLAPTDLVALTGATTASIAAT